MEQALYFAYGSNLDATQMTERCPSSLPLGRARLQHHRLDFTYYSSRWSGGAADVLPHSDQEVWGLLYRLPAADLARLDRFEAGYDRVLLQVESDRGSGLCVYSYTVREKRSFRPSAAYIEKILRWARHWKFPSEYIAGLERCERLAHPVRSTAYQPQ
jgi:gamma-glutamylcyclotransferase (GGCT)/AIG2-like uncharacterized protein YtfP